jgi:hypothetical protein
VATWQGVTSLPLEITSSSRCVMFTGPDDPWPLLPRHARLPAARDDQPGSGRRHHRSLEQTQRRGARSGCARSLFRDFHAATPPPRPRAAGMSLSSDGGRCNLQPQGIEDGLSALVIARDSQGPTSPARRRGTMREPGRGRSARWSPGLRDEKPDQPIGHYGWHTHRSATYAPSWDPAGWLASPIGCRPGAPTWRDGKAAAPR